MAKIMLVEDDNNLREIYGARLLAEGYIIVSAKDGEEALAMAVKERPDLIISDVMMPKISGFDMLDILRSTPETKSTKVIMMTALSQAEDKARADKLGADRYLVKSQVTLEDVAKAAREVLAGDAAAVPAAAPAVTAVPAPVAEPVPVVVPSPTAVPATQIPVAVAPEPVAVVAPAAAIPVVAAPANTPVPTQPVTLANVPVTPAAPLVSPVAAPAAAVPAPAITGASNIQTVEVANTDTGNGAGVVMAPQVMVVPAVADPNAPLTAVAGADVAPQVISPNNQQTLANAVAAFSPAATPPPASSVLPSDSNANPSEHPRTSVHTKVINPINDLTKSSDDFQKLLAAEEAKEATPVAPTDTPAAAPVAAAPAAPATTAVVNQVSEEKPSKLGAAAASAIEAIVPDTPQEKTEKPATT